MKVKVFVDKDIIQRTFEKALLNEIEERGDLFQDVRRFFKKELEKIFIEHGVKVYRNVSLGNRANLISGKVVEKEPIIVKDWLTEEDKKLDVKFCSKFGHGDYSLTATNYWNDFHYFPSLWAFFKNDEFSIGNISVLVENGGYDIEIILWEGIKIVGYSYHITPRKKKSYVCLFGIRFKREALEPIFKKYYENCECKNVYLDEVRIGLVTFPIIFICRRCGKIYTCRCFEDYIDIEQDIFRFVSLKNVETKERIRNIKFKPNICHLCTKKFPKLTYGSSMYYSSFLQKFLPYYNLFAKRKYSSTLLKRNQAKENENELRERFGYPKIGEKWNSETQLFKIVQTIFSDKKVIHHYRGKELEGLEIDIWIPELKLGIEYQGEQHFRVFKHWGGEEGFKKRAERDKKKRMLCKKLGYKLIEFKYDEELTVDYVVKKLSPYLRDRV